MNTLSIQNKVIAVLIAVFLLISFLIISPALKKVGADSLYFAPPVSTASASSSPVFMTPGTATTTLYYDSYNQTTNNSNAFKTDAGYLAVQFSASSSVSTLQINEEYALDTVDASGNQVNCKLTPNACDWYASAPNLLNVSASTTLSSSASSQIFDVAPVSKYSWLFASSTTGGNAAVANNNIDGRLISIQTPTRYIRFVFSMKVVVNGNGAIYAQFIPNKQKP